MATKYLSGGLLDTNGPILITCIPLITVCCIILNFIVLIHLSESQISNIAQRVEKFKSIDETWECRGCGDERNHHYIFNIVRRAMYRESREVYLNFDHSWIDTALMLDSKVIVYNVNRELLSEHMMPDFVEPPEKFLDDRTVKETYFALVSLLKFIPSLY
jgi:hypothetical protein